ncbi:NAD(P)-dependent dehydrogenase (short-subunit alcohol dehydrogenase family) [Mycobacterium frederiksbergense]|uniref:NAD(P)-dependent dehydrogenase (Short-subunit alcohol dehydrogenase family) n=1 Tax=Mycolicibacterium frederiksbergense TaxID=117567 RepID=A0ABT6L5X6_9MYCO|nr:SDR family NAD(P)-dependent oxidoreductase [Mycolicibacterium frederiksbergense]MDH6197360.1 NAD(P)-dependent dehydrogenase (short-subunit alcohol dehydrogenase family) [Mycolicibacterium frederiksbergense]
MTTVFITGGHSGIGLECSRQLADRGVNIVLAGRSPAKMQSVADELRAIRDISVVTVELDTSSLASVRSAAVRCAALIERGEIGPLQAVLCNAGGRFDGEEKYSPEGYELTFATNCLGHFLLTELLLPMMPADGRVVFTASGTHDPDTMDGKLVGKAVEANAITLANDGKNGGKPLSVGKRYATSKLCTIMYAYELARRLDRAGSSIASVAYDPGAVPETGLLRDMPKALRWLATSSLVKLAFKRIGVTTSTVTFSGAALADLAVNEQYATKSGQYFQANQGKLSQMRSSKASYDEQRAVTLWNDSKRLVGL